MKILSVIPQGVHEARKMLRMPAMTIKATLLK